MPLLGNFNVIAAHGKLEQGDNVICHELSGDRTTRQTRKLLTATSDILCCLNRSESIVPALCLNRDDKLLAVSVDPNVDFINFNLPDVRDGSSKMALERVGGDARKMSTSRLYLTFARSACSSLSAFAVMISAVASGILMARSSALGMMRLTLTSLNR